MKENNKPIQKTLDRIYRFGRSELVKVYEVIEDFYRTGDLYCIDQIFELLATEPNLKRAYNEIEVTLSILTATNNSSTFTFTFPQRKTFVDKLEELIIKEEGPNRAYSYLIGLR